MRERDVEKYLKKEVHKIGGLALKWVSPGQKGVPDQLVFYEHRVYGVELKRPKKKPEPLQQEIHDRLKKTGFHVHVTDTHDKVDQFVSNIQLLADYYAR